MHIAICDDNVADRKQTERLMGREADKWIAVGKPLYVYSYGSLESLLSNSMKFDAVILDTSDKASADFGSLLQRMTAAGIDGAVVYSDPSLEEACSVRDSIFLPKPIVPAELHGALIKVEKISLGRVHLIELRGIRETLYVEADDILYAIQSGEYTDVTLKDKRSIRIQGIADNFYDEIRGRHENFVSVSYSVVINVNHVDYVGHFSLLMSDGTKLRAGREVRSYIKHKKEM